MTIQRQVGEAGLGPIVLPSPAPGVILIEVSRNWTVNFPKAVHCYLWYWVSKTLIMMAISDISSKAVNDGTFEEDFGDLGLSALQVSLWCHYDGPGPGPSFPHDFRCQNHGAHDFVAFPHKFYQRWRVWASWLLAFTSLIQRSLMWSLSWFLSWWV